MRKKDMMKSKLKGGASAFCRPGPVTDHPAMAVPVHATTPLTRSSFLRLVTVGATLSLWCSVSAGTALAQDQSQPPSAKDTLDYNAPWDTTPPKAKTKAKKKAEPAAQPAATTPPEPSPAPVNPPAAATPVPVPAAPPTPETPAVTTPAPADTTTPGQATPAVTSPAPVVADTAPSAAPSAPRITHNEIAASADYFEGQGRVTLPFGYSLSKLPGLARNIHESVASPSRNSEYYGGTLAYSYGQALFVDFAYAKGSSSGNASFQPLSSPVPSQFTIKDDWYQLYLRYEFRLPVKRFTGYLRAGASYVTADLTDSSVIPALGYYEQTDHTKDILGNLGFGLGYSVYRTSHIRIGLQGDGEGFYGRRSQESLETLPLAAPLAFQSDTIHNTIYGGIARASAHLEYRFGDSGLFRVFTDGGYQVKYTIVDYPNGVSAPNEWLYGPYVKVGLRYAF